MSSVKPDVKEIFFRAMEQPSRDSLNTFLASECGEDAEVRQRVEALIKAHQQAGKFLEGATSSAHSTPADERPGTVIGSYKLLQQIGEGGFGVVYMAEQLEHVRRKVALKIIKPGMDSREVIARFESERQALALMDHPNIAKVFDAGTIPLRIVEDGLGGDEDAGEACESDPASADRKSRSPHSMGRPYFVMELVRGVPITDYCDKNNLCTADRLKLFLSVCRAVQHAHQKGVIHRDIKPSNVMVTLHDGEPVPKVIDFGVAKATNQHLTEKTLFTAYGQMIGTPVYMSPEQAEISGLDIDTRSDIYSLGVLLYELLTGTTPFDGGRLRAAGFAEMQRIIREEDPPRPSTRVSTLGDALTVISNQRGTDPKRLRQLLRGDLDLIVMKSLEKDRNRRYDTANGLASDIDRYLNHDAILARPPSTAYRLRKFVARNKVVVTTVVLVLAALLAGTVISTWQAIRANLATDLAHRERDAAHMAEQKASAERNNVALAKAKLQDANSQLRAKQDELQQTLYAAEMNLVQAAWDADNVGLVQELLNRQIPKPGARDLRGFEWHYWQRLCHNELHALSLPGGCWFDGPMAMSHDGSRIVASISSPPEQAVEVKIFDSLSGKQLRTLEKLPGVFFTASFNKDNSRVLTVTGGHVRGLAAPAEPNCAKVWDAATGKQLFECADPRSNVTAAISPQGDRVTTVIRNFVAGGSSGTSLAKVWDIDSGKELFQKSSEYAFGQLAFSPDGTRLALSAVTYDSRLNALDCQVLIWDAFTGEEIVASAKHEGEIRSRLTFSPDGGRLASVWEEHGVTTDVKIWDAATGNVLSSIPLPRGSAIANIRFSPDGKQLLGFGPAPTAYVWNAETGEMLRTIKGNVTHILAAAFSADGSRVFTVDGDRMVKIWNAQLPDPTHEKPIHDESQWADGIAMDPSGSQLAAFGWSGDQKSSVLLWLDINGKPLASVPTPGGHAHEISFSADAKRLAYVWHQITDAESFYQLNVHDAVTGVELRHVKAKSGMSLVGAALSPDGRRVASIAAIWSGTNHAMVEQCELSIWEVDRDQVHVTIPAPRNAYWSNVSFSPDGQFLAVSLIPFCPLTDTSNLSTADVATAFWMPMLLLVNPETGKTIRYFEGPTEINRLVFSRDGGLLAAAFGRLGEVGRPGKVMIWDTRTGKHLSTLSGHSSEVHAVAFSPDGSRVATRAGERRSGVGEVMVWDTSSGQVLLTLKQPPWGIGDVAFTPDGNRLVTAGIIAKNGEYIRVWDATPIPGLSPR